MKKAEAKVMFSGVRMYLVSGNMVFTSFNAVSGKYTVTGANSIKFGYGENDQKKKDSGPLPEGEYRIDLSTLRDYEHTKGTYAKSLVAFTAGMTPGKFLEKTDRAWGRFEGRKGQIIPILNKAGGQKYTFGRDNAWIHGSDFPGSIGCIDLGAHMDNFVAALLELTRDSSAKIPLIVRYGLTPTGREVREIDAKGRDISRVA